MTVAVACTVRTAAGAHEIEVALPGRPGHTVRDLLARWGLESANGVAIDGIWYPPVTDLTDVVLRRGATLVVGSGDNGDRGIDPAPAVGRVRADGTQPWRRPPRMEFPVSPPPITLPQDRPDPVTTRRFGVAGLVIPVLVAIMMAALWNPMFAVFALLSPLMALSNWADDRRRHRKQRRSNADLAERDLDRLEARLVSTMTFDLAVRRRTHPAINELVCRVTTADGRLWERRPDHDDFLRVSAGWGCLPWKPVTQSQGEPHPAAYDLLANNATIHEAPIPIGLVEGCVVGVVGPRQRALAVVRSLLLQVVAHHGPGDCALSIVTEDPEAWDWAKWLPHLVLDAVGSRAVAATPDDFIPTGRDHDVLIVDVPDLAEPAWLSLRDRIAVVPGAAIAVAATVDRLPSQSSVIVDVGAKAISSPATGVVVPDVVLSSATTAQSRLVATALARYHDPDVREMGVDLPSHVRLLDLLGMDRADSGVIARRWQSQPPVAQLCAPIGDQGGAVFYVDPVGDGPHGLLAGTTGSGKSELLRTLVASLAATVDSEHLNFVLIDYKGGSAFDACARLPHTVGLVTDLDDHLAGRALACLEAELRHREERLRACGAENLDQFHTAPEGDPLPRLLVVIDEFAALAKELPDFMDALVDIAQRGRSLGVHLLLATQRPHGVINDAIRANTNLRISLRV